MDPEANTEGGVGQQKSQSLEKIVNLRETAAATVAIARESDCSSSDMGDEYDDADDGGGDGDGDEARRLTVTMAWGAGESGVAGIEQKHVNEEGESDRNCERKTSAEGDHDDDGMAAAATAALAAPPPPPPLPLPTPATPATPETTTPPVSAPLAVAAAAAAAVAALPAPAPAPAATPPPASPPPASPPVPAAKSAAIQGATERDDDDADTSADGMSTEEIAAKLPSNDQKEAALSGSGLEQEGDQTGEGGQETQWTPPVHAPIENLRQVRGLLV